MIDALEELMHKIGVIVRALIILILLASIILLWTFSKRSSIKAKEQENMTVEEQMKEIEKMDKNGDGYIDAWEILFS